ncbi:hypothetical protein FKM82_006432 [Ascaphus truei]
MSLLIDGNNDVTACVFAWQADCPVGESTATHVGVTQDHVTSQLLPPPSASERLRARAAHSAFRNHRLGRVLIIITAVPPARRMGVDWFGFGYAALIASGGIIGYAKAGSVPSLAAGLVFGGLAGVGAYQMSNDSKNVLLSLIASGTLAGVMGFRFYNSGRFMPAGLIAGASILMVGRLGLKMLEKPHDT